MPSSDAIGDYYPPKSPDFPELKRSTDAPGCSFPRTPQNIPIWVQAPAPGVSPSPAESTFVPIPKGQQFPRDCKLDVSTHSEPISIPIPKTQLNPEEYDTFHSGSPPK
jgi:hypothetical protein